MPRLETTSSLLRPKGLIQRELGSIVLVRGLVRVSVNRDSGWCEFDGTYSSPMAPFKVPTMTPLTRMGSEFSIRTVSVARSSSCGPSEPAPMEAPKSSRKANLES